MKMMEAMVVALLFNFMITIFGAIQIIPSNVYQSTFQGAQEINGTNYQMGKQFESQEANYGGLVYTAATLIVGFAGALLTASLLGYFFKVQNSMQTAVVSFVGGVFWSSWAGTSLLIGNLVKTIPVVGVMIWGGFTVLMIIVFVIGIGQLATGGWKAHV